MAAPTDSNRALKFVVISMGLVLIGGTILLFALVFSKMSGEKEEASAIYVPRGYRDCAQVEIPLQTAETIRSIEFDDMVARIITDLPNGESSLKLVHSCSGELLGSVTFTHGQTPQ